MFSMGRLGNRKPQLVTDTSECINISPLALTKMLIHGRAGIPMEVMGLMLGKVIDEFTINVVDVFAMPQSGTGVSVEAVDPVFQTTMLDMLRQVGRPETVVGWYHSHPGFGCWLSSVDVNTQQSFEQLDSRAVAVVVDPIQSVRGLVVMDAFRLMDPSAMISGASTRNTTTNRGFLNKPSLQALMHNLNRQYYSINTETKKTESVQHVLINLKEESWENAIHPGSWTSYEASNEAAIDKIQSLLNEYSTRIDQEKDKDPLELLVLNTGKIDPKIQLEKFTEETIMAANLQIMTSLVDAVIF